MKLGVSTIGLYLNRLLLSRLGIVLLAVAGFASVFDLLDAIDDVVDDRSWPLLSVILYLFLRLPSLLSQLLPLIVLLGGLYFITDLMRNNELTVIWAMGRSTRQVILKLMPMLFLIAGFKFILDDQLVPKSTEVLRDWRVGIFKRTDIVGSSSSDIWLRSGGDIVRIAAESAVMGEIFDVSIFQRDEQGKLTARIDAAAAEQTDGGWYLIDAVTHGPGNGRAERNERLPWDGDINVDHVEKLARPARELTFINLLGIIKAKAYSIRAVDPYTTWAHHRIIGSLIPSLLLTLVLALARSFSRSGNAMSILTPAVGIGFSFLIVNGVILALGEVAIIPPVIAAWAPSLILFVVILMLLMRTNRLVATRLSATVSP